MPHHEHDSETSHYLGSEERKDNKYDFYYQGGDMPTVIARFGPHGDYQSGLIFVKSNLHEEKDTVEQLKEFIKGDNEPLSLLSTATLLSIEQGFMDSHLKEIKKTPKPR